MDAITLQTNNNQKKRLLLLWFQQIHINGIDVLLLRDNKKWSRKSKHRSEENWIAKKNYDERKDKIATITVTKAESIAVQASVEEQQQKMEWNVSIVTNKSCKGAAVRGESERRQGSTD